jgi:predicted  nucleic acid-binding Zn-ribbon protein
MPTTCEVCGMVDESAVDEYLQVCPGCISDRRHPEESAAGRAEDAAD